jgi:hypothetical protein
MVIRIFITLREVLIFMPHILAALTPGVEEAADSAASGRGEPDRRLAFDGIERPATARKLTVGSIPSVNVGDWLLICTLD